MRHSVRLDKLSLSLETKRVTCGMNHVEIAELTENNKEVFTNAFELLTRGPAVKCGTCVKEDCDKHDSPLKAANDCLKKAKEVLFNQIDSHDWPDRKERLYDTPISDKLLPGHTAQQFQKYNFQRIVSSPFRRSLQTASLVAQALKIARVDVHYGLGEDMKNVIRELNENGQSKDDFCYLDETQMREVLGPVALGVVMKVQPNINEHDNLDDGSRSFESYYRHEDTMMYLKKIYLGENVLVVSHAKSIFAAGWPRGQKYDVNIPECGWLVINNDSTHHDHGTVVDQSEGIKSEDLSPEQAKKFEAEYEKFRERLQNSKGRSLYDPSGQRGSSIIVTCPLESEPDLLSIPKNNFWYLFLGLHIFVILAVLFLVLRIYQIHRSQSQYGRGPSHLLGSP